MLTLIIFSFSLKKTPNYKHTIVDAIIWIFSSIKNTISIDKFSLAQAFNGLHSLLTHRARHGSTPCSLIGPWPSQIRFLFLYCSIIALFQI